jgi:hypothetical protein
MPDDQAEFKEIEECLPAPEEWDSIAVVEGPGNIFYPTRLSDVEAKPIEWLWPGTVPIGKVTVIAGDPGRGKSLITLDLAARLSRRMAWPTGIPNDHAPARSLLVSAEDDPPDTIRPRLDANGADPAMVHFLDSSEGPAASRAFQIPKDIPRLEALAASLQVRLIVFDPVMAFLGPGNASNQGIRSAVAAMQVLASQIRCAVIFITHLTKSAASSPLYRAMGSIGLVASARAVHLCWPDEEKPGRCLFLPLKCNLSQTLRAFAYSVATRDGSAPFIEWEPEPVPLSLLSTSTANPIPRIEDARCAAWLKEVLTEGPASVAEVQKAAMSAGFSRNSLRRAKKAIEASSFPDGPGGPWIISLTRSLFPSSEPSGKEQNGQAGKDLLRGRD